MTPISLIVPVYNEEASIQTFYQAVRSFAYFKDYAVEIIFINDGSTDNTENIVTQICNADPLVKLINFSRNFGKEAATFAGLNYANGDLIIPMDVDLQDPIEVIPRLIEKHQEGYDVVLAKRSKRFDESFMKKFLAKYFYKVYNKIVEIKIVENGGDFRLMTKKVVEAIKTLPENQLFMRGVFSWVGFKTAVVEFKRPGRARGTTKFTNWKAFEHALNGITSFSTFPLRMWTYMGALISGISFLYGLFIIIAKLFNKSYIPGYPSLMVAVLFLAGVQLIGIGTLGEYIGKIYSESKRRPKYIVRNVVSSKTPVKNTTYYP